MPVSTRNIWFNPIGTQPVQPRMRLIALPFAGGSGLALRDWQRAAPDECAFLAVQLPGRERRLHETPFLDAEKAAAVLAREIAALGWLPFALMGHSMGSLLGFLVARELRAAGLPGPAHLFVSGFRAPHLPNTRPWASKMSEEDFLMELERLGATAPEILANAELMALLLPVLRSDFTLVESYRYREGPPLICPITAFAGTEDIEAGPEQMADWASQTSRKFQLCACPGDHFFIQDRDVSVHDTVRSTLTELIRPPATAIVKAGNDRDTMNANVKKS